MGKRRQDLSQPAGGKEPELLEGWTRRFIACEPRLSEAAALYRDSGFEVRLVPLSSEPGCNGCEGPDEAPCLICYQGQEGRYRVIYTRPIPTPKAPKEQA